VDTDAVYGYKQLAGNYFSVAFKIIVSHSEYFCYFWMLVATLSNGGLLYMFYPIVIFGYALLLEERPGKWFWFLVLGYTQVMIILNFMLMLTLWQVLLGESGPLN
jgi:hypothetical protein